MNYGPQDFGPYTFPATKLSKAEGELVATALEAWPLDVVNYWFQDQPIAGLLSAAVRLAKEPQSASQGCPILALAASRTAAGADVPTWEAALRQALQDLTWTVFGRNTPDFLPFFVQYLRSGQRDALIANLRTAG